MMTVNLSLIFVMAGGYIINDWMDAESDAANQKEGVIPFIPRRTIYISYISANAIGFLLAFWICNDIRNYQLLTIPLAVIAILLMYSTNLKSTPLLGNFVIAVLSGAIPILPLTFDYGFETFTMDFESTPIYFLGFLAFLVSFIREQVKDMEDLEGDLSQGQTTFPAVMGIEAARWTAFIFFMFFLLLILLMLYYLAFVNYITSIYLFIFVFVPTGALAFKLTRARIDKDFHQVSTGLKWIMLAGLIFAIVYYLS